MSVIGFNITKIDAEKEKNPSGKVNVESNVSIKKVGTSDVSFGSPDEKVLDVSFEFKTSYSPEVGHITLGGNLLYLTKEKEAQEIADDWKETKKLDKTVVKPILNTILARGNIQALILSRDLNLPAPLRLPKVQDK